VPTARPEFFDRGERHTEDERIETGPGGVVDQGLETAERDTAVAEILPSQEPAKREAAEHDGARDNHGSAAVANHEQQDEREEEIELVFDGERPGVGESGAAMQPDVLHGDEKFPPRRHLGILAPRRQKNVKREDNEVGRQNAQGAAGKETAKLDGPIARERREQLAANQISAEDEEKIDTDPAPAMHPAGERKAHDPGVVNDDDDDGESTKKIETRLTFAITEARIDMKRRSEPEWHFSFGSGLMNGGKVAGASGTGIYFPLPIVRPPRPSRAREQAE
jgi:hypothetical protein